MSNLDHRFTWTEFFSVGADRKEEHTENLRELKARIERTKKKGKQQLPWFKGARFGEDRTEKNSLKTDANLIGVTAIEVDYDGEGAKKPWTIEEAAAELKRLHVTALLYSTPSSTPEKPRWRCICPLGREWPGADRQRFLARLNGVFGGSLDPASFNLSLSYYYGSIPGKPRVKVVLVDGSLFLDDMASLDKGARGRRARRASEDDDVLGPRKSRGVKADIDPAEAERLLMSIKNDERFDERDDWRNVIAAIHHQFDGEPEGLELAHKWSATWTAGGDNPDYTEATYESFAGGSLGRPKTFLWIIKLAAEAGVTARARTVNAAAEFEELPPLESDKVNSTAKERNEPSAVLTEEHTEPDEDLLGPRTSAPLPDDPILAMNKRHAVVQLGNKVRIMVEKPDGGLSLLQKTDFHTLWENKRIQISPKVSIPISEAWMQSEGRRTYHGGLVFRPMGKVPSYTYNLFQGFPIKPNEDGSCELFKTHLLENVCLGLDVYYRYLIGWMADLIQHPGAKPGVAVVLRGLKGVGKDVVGAHLGALCPQNYVPISEMDQLTGKFNAHFERALLIHVEEGLWAGDKRSEGPLKSLITRSSIALEKKGIDVIMVENSSRVFITSNNLWVVPATKDERRFAVYEVGDAHRLDRPYFRAMAKQMLAGGYARLMWELSTMDITDFDVGDPPDTIGLANQKIAGLKGADAYWRAVLEDAEIPAEKGFSDLEANWIADGIVVTINALYEHYREWWKENRGFGHGPLLSKEDFGRAISFMCPSREKAQRRFSGERLTCHILPKLAQCRSEFEGYLGSTVQWPDEPEPDLVG